MINVKLVVLVSTLVVVFTTLGVGLLVVGKQQSGLVVCTVAVYVLVRGGWTIAAERRRARSRQ